MDVHNKVLNFYKSLPFNINQTPQEAAQLICEKNNVAAIYPNEDDLYYAKSIVEMGCGTGWLANSIAFWYGTKCLAVDYNSVAIEFAEQVAQILDVDNEFFCADLFKYQPDLPGGGRYSNF